jgi:hypothetical protein
MIRYLHHHDWQKIQSFIQKAWGESHHLNDQELFMWQHAGPDPDCDQFVCSVIEEYGQILGLRGLQQLDFQIYDASDQLKIVKGCTAPFMFVLERYRGLHGLRLYKRTLRDFPVVLYLGANKSTTLKLHRMSGYQTFDRLPRFGLKLRKANKPNQVEIFDSVINPSHLHRIWLAFSEVFRPFSIYRSEEFFEWRYLKAPYWNYRMLFSKHLPAVAVYRLENVTIAGRVVGSAMRVLETFYDPKTISREQFCSFLKAIISYANQKKCIYIDHFQTMRPIQTSLEEAGFFEVSGETDDFPSLFDPIDFKKPPINYGWFVKEPNMISLGMNSHHYVVKSDSDQDRPVPTSSLSAISLD